MLCAALVLCMHVTLKHLDVLATWSFIPSIEPDRMLSLGELTVFTLMFVLGLPAALSLGKAFSASAYRRFSNLVARGGLVLPALVAGVASFCISHFVTDDSWFTDDEQAYLFQVHAYRSLTMAVRAIQPEQIFHHPFVVISRTDAGGPFWAGTYPILQPAMMTLSSLLGNALLSQWLCASAITYATGSLANRLTGGRLIGLGAAWLCASSPMLIGLSATYHTSVLCTLLSVATLHACLSAQKRPTLLWGGITGLCAGATFLTRGLEGTLMVVVSGALLLWFSRTRLLRALPMMLGFVLLGTLCFSVHLWVNHETTGDWFDSPYAVWGRQFGRIMGFGEHMMWNRTHSPVHGISQTFTTLTRLNSWGFAGPLSVLLPLCALFLPLRDRAARWLLVLSFLQLAGYFFLAFGSVHDFGGAYHVWHLPWLAIASMCVVKHARVAVKSAGRFVFAMSIVGCLVFWPVQVRRWHAVAEAVQAPIRAAEAAIGGQKAFVLWSSMGATGTHTWVHYPPTPFPHNRILWAIDVPGAYEYLHSVYPDRQVFRLVWEGPVARVVSVEPAVAPP